MRLDEFDDVCDNDLILIEFVNADVISPSYEKEFPIQNGKLTALVKGKSDGLKIVIYDPDSVQLGAGYSEEMMKDIMKNLPIAWADFKYQKSDDALVADMVWVGSTYRGQGLAKEMYSLIYELGNSVKPSPVQLVDGKKMWEKFKKEKLPFAPEDTPAQKLIQLGKDFVNIFRKKFGI